MFLAILLLVLVPSLVQAVTITQVTMQCQAPECWEYNFEDDPRWSPDGRHIAFLGGGVDRSYYLAGANVAVMPSPGAPGPAPDFSLGQYLLGPPHAYVTAEPTWSPEGHRIACWTHDGNVAVLTANDSTVHRVPRVTGSGKIDWAPHEDKIAVALAEGIASVDVVSGSATLITTTPGWDPDWSPDGQWIAFASLVSGNADVWIAPTNGGASRQVTTHEGFDSSPTWSPDGRTLAFASDRSGNMDIWVIEIHRGKTLQVTTDPARDVSPDWSPDGRRILFVSDRADAGFSHIWMASDLHTLPAELTSWTEIKQRYRD